jgi:Pyruvate/2-oxoacid:ferredoxin oxidoreductase delta subunit
VPADRYGNQHGRVERTFDANTLTLKQPQMDSKLCIGCGIRENKCPVAGQSAILVKSV